MKSSREKNMLNMPPLVNAAGYREKYITADNHSLVHLTYHYLYKISTLAWLYGLGVFTFVLPLTKKGNITNAKNYITMNLVQNITTIIFGMHDQLSCQCFAINLGMQQGKIATDEELLTMQRTLNVIKSLRKELEMVTAGMVMTVEPKQEKAANTAPAATPPPTKAATPPPSEPVATTAQSAKGTTTDTPRSSASRLQIPPEPQVHAALVPEMAAVVRSSYKPLIRGHKRSEAHMPIAVGRR
jgi:hypothetical protein